MINKILKISATILILLLLILSPRRNFTEAQENQNDNAYSWDKSKCPVDISDFEAPSFLEKNFSLLNVDDYQEYMKTFHQNLKNKLITELMEYYSEKYKMTISEELMTKVVDGKELLLPEKDETDFDTTIRIKSEIKSCMFEDLMVAETVEKVKIEMENQAFVTNTLIDMLTKLQNQHNLHRTKQLEPEVTVNSDSTNTLAVNPIR